MRRKLLFMGVFVLLAGCSGGSGTLQTNLPTAAQLRAVPLSLGVSGATLVGSTNVWRNMMPTVILAGEPAPKTGVIVSFTARASDNAPIPGGLRAEKITVTNGDEVWASTEVEIRSDEAAFGGTVRNGPEWPVGSALDVVIDFRDSIGGTYQLRAVGQVLQGAY
jgi:hypothetical protein